MEEGKKGQKARGQTKRLSKKKAAQAKEDAKIAGRGLGICPIPRQLTLFTSPEWAFPKNRMSFAKKCLIVVQAPQPQDILFSAERVQGLLTEHHISSEITAYNSGDERTAEGQIYLIQLMLRGEGSLKEEVYTLDITLDGKICVESCSPQGIFRGITTLCQLIGAQNFDGPSTNGVFLPRLTIKDSPSFPNRGVMLVQRFAFHISHSLSNRSQT